MYYPYLRGKQFELILLRDNAKFIADNNIHPIIEPVKSDFSALKRAMKALNQENVNCTLIINPKTGQEPIPTATISSELIEDGFKEYKNLCIGYLLNPESKLNDLIAILKKYPKVNFTIIHYGFTDGEGLAVAIDGHSNIKTHVFIENFAQKLYRRHFKKDGIKRILIRDGFKQKKKNADYAFDEHFSDLHITYPDEGMDGFGDYLMVGDEYSETGGAAYAVAIHLTYLKNDDDMHIYHFISDRTDSPVDPGGKFLEALAKLVKEVKKDKSSIYKSRACNEYLALYDKKHFPGLGYVKKLSMQHHIELIAYYLGREK